MIERQYDDDKATLKPKITVDKNMISLAGEY
jgi:hypothetical protein